MLAGQVLESDTDIDRLEVDVEEECLKVLALYQPVAGDLRFIIAILKINNDLERVGDLAVNIAERSIFLASRERLDMPFDFTKMMDKTREMLRMSLDALVNRDASLAHRIILADDEVDVYLLDRKVDKNDANDLNLETMVDLDMGVFTNTSDNADYELVSNDEIAKRLLGYDHVFMY